MLELKEQKNQRTHESLLRILILGIQIKARREKRM